MIDRQIGAFVKTNTCNLFSIVTQHNLRQGWSGFCTSAVLLFMNFDKLFLLANIINRCYNVEKIGGENNAKP